MCKIPVKMVCILLHCTAFQCMHCLTLLALHCIALYYIPVGRRMDIIFLLRVKWRWQSTHMPPINSEIAFDFGKIVDKARFLHWYALPSWQATKFSWLLYLLIYFSIIYSWHDVIITAMLLNVSNAFNPTNKSQLTTAITVHSNTRYVEPQKLLAFFFAIARNPC